MEIKNGDISSPSHALSLPLSLSLSLTFLKVRWLLSLAHTLSGPRCFFSGFDPLDNFWLVVTAE